MIGKGRGRGRRGREPQTDPERLEPELGLDPGDDDGDDPAPVADNPDDSDFDYDLRRPRRRRLLAAAGAAGALLVFAGILWIAYDDGGPSAPGDQPVLISADQRPGRIRPQDPGGADVPNQDVTVYDHLEGGDRPAPGAEPARPGGGQAETLLPPPEQPLAPARPDAPPPTAEAGGGRESLTTERPRISVAPRPVHPPRPGNGATAPVPPRAEPATSPQPAPEAAQPAPEVAQPAPEAAQPAPEAAQAETPAETAPPTPPATDAGPQVAAANLPPAPRPRPTPPARPAAATAVPGTPGAAPAATWDSPVTAPTTPATPATAPAAAGGWAIQVAALRQEASARREGARIRQAYPDLLGSLTPQVVRADLGDKGVFYRVRLGPVSSRNAAEALCQALRARNKDQGCLAVR